MGKPSRKTKKRVGRPPDPVQRVPLSLRVTPDVKKQLDTAAKQSGRSQSQEAEFRLEQSFRTVDLFDQILGLAYQRPTAGIVKFVGDVFHLTAQRASFNAATKFEDRL